MMIKGLAGLYRGGRNLYCGLSSSKDMGGQESCRDTPWKTKLAPFSPYEDLSMLNLVLMRFLQVHEIILCNGWCSLFHEIIYKNRALIIVEKELKDVGKTLEFLIRSKTEFIEITPDTLKKVCGLYHCRNRHYKALHYLKKGYGGHAIIRKGQVIGDIWHYSLRGQNGSKVHPDVQRLGLDLKDDHVYFFDMFVAPEERKNGLSAALQSNAMHLMKEYGYTKAYGFYWADNIPALWTSRVMNRWKEVRRMKMSRFVFLKIPKNSNKSMRGKCHELQGYPDGRK